MSVAVALALEVKAGKIEGAGVAVSCGFWPSGVNNTGQKKPMKKDRIRKTKPARIIQVLFKAKNLADGKKALLLQTMNPGG